MIGEIPRLPHEDQWRRAGKLTHERFSVSGCKFKDPDAVYRDI